MLSALLSCSLVLSSCQAIHSSEARPGERVFTLNLGTEPPELDPAKVTDLTSSSVLLNLMRGLTQLGATSEPIPAVAERWELSKDGLHYIFYLRKDALWSDGRPVTASDFVNGWKRSLTAESASEYAFFLFDVKNAKGFFDKKVTDFAQVGVHALDDHRLQVDLERPVPFFLSLVAAPVAMPVREDNIRQYGDQFTEAGKFITNGPYLLDAWVHEERIRLKPNPRYYGHHPEIDRVEMLMVNDANTSVVMYENNELDYIETPTSIPSFDVRRLRKRPDYHSGKLFALYYFGFNTDVPPFNNPKVRQAFAYALDRSYYPRLLQSGQQPTTSLIPPGMLGYNDTLGLPYNPEKAKQLLTEAGYPDGKGFPTVELSYRTLYDIQKESEIAQYLWRKNLNVNVRLRNMEWKVFLKKLDDKSEPIQIYRLSWYADFPDPDTFMSLFTKTNGNNHTRWGSTEYDQWVSEAVVTLSPEKRKALYDQAQRVLLEDSAAIIPVYVAEKGYLLRPTVKGLQVNGLNLLNLDNLSLAPQKTQVH